MRNLKTPSQTILPLLIMASVAACSGSKPQAGISPQRRDK